MRNLVPHFILEKYNSGETHGSLPAVGLFVDISGFSRITDELMEHGQHGAEVIADLMSNLFTPLIQITYEQGGFISTLAGDAFTAIFPMEEDEETTCLRTLSAAWQIQQDFEALTKQSTPFGEFSISGKIGIAKGEAIWGIVTSNDKRRATFYFAGSAVEESAEAEGKASSGEVLVNAQFQSVIGNSADFVLQDEHFKVSRIDFQLLAPKTIHPTSTESNLAFKFYPPTLFNQAHSGEFRQVVTMFINLPTVRTEDQLDIFMDSLFGLQDKYGGLLTRLDFGDKGSNLLMFWGAPVAFENDIERALNLILNLQIVTSIPINAGITYRIAHAGFIGSSLREEYSTYGRGVNLAARFMSAANRGEIWVDEEIAKRAVDKFEIIFDDEYSFKGFAQKQKVYLLEERKEAIEAIYQTDLVGRQTELKEMADFIRPLSENQYCGGLILLGDPGIGKTRLVNEFSNQVKGDVQWALCQCDQTMRESFHPISYWLRQYFSISAFQNEARNKRNFNRKIDRVISSLKDDMLAAELDRTRSFLGALIELYWSDSLYEQVDPQGRYDNTLIGLVSLIQAESSFQPLILQLEDAQWLDEDSWKLLAQLDRTIKSNPDNSFPIAIFATARLEFLSTPLTDGITFEELRIGELSDKSLKGLAEQILGGPISPRLLELLEGRADGNPFFAEQIVHYLLDEEKLRKVNGVWDIGDSTQSPLPDNIRALLISRIDRLAQEVKEVVLTAAVLGKEFEIRLLSCMLNGDLNLAEKIEEAERQSIWSKISELRYLFNHALLLDAAYQMQVHSRRQALHKSAVQAIESLYAEETSAHSTDLAYHCEMAGLADKARNYLIQAAKIAKKDYQNTQAVDLYSRALNLTPEKDFSTRYEILYEREKIFSYLGQPENQVADLEQLGQLINTEEVKFSDQEKNKYLSKLAAKWANYKIETGDYKGAITSVEEMISIAEIENLKEDLVDAYFLWAISSYHLGYLEEAAKQGSTGLSNASSLGYLDGEANLINLMGLIALGMDKPKEAQEYFEHSLDLAMKVGNLRDQARALNNLGIAALSRGYFDSAHEYYLRSFELVRKIGDLPSESLLMNNLGYIAGNLGDYTTASEFYMQSLVSARQIGNQIQEAYTFINSSSVYRALEEFDKALSFANNGLAITREFGNRDWEAWALTSIGNTLFELSDLDEAENSFKAAIEIRRSMEQNNLECELFSCLARISLRKGEFNSALAYIDQIIDYLESGGSLEGTEDPIRVYLTCYQVLQNIDDSRSTKMLEAGHQLLQDRAANINNETMRNNFYENIPHNKELLQDWQALQN